MIAALALAGLGALGAGGAAAALRGLLAPGLWAQAAGAAVLGAAGLAALVDGGVTGSAFTGQLEPHVGIDGLSGLFLLTLGAVAAPALVFATRYLRPDAQGRAVAALSAAFVLAMTLVLCARDPLTFLTGWELMSLVPAAAILVTRGASRAARRTVFVYVAFTHLAGAGTWVAVLLLARAGAIDGASALETGSSLQVAAVLAAIVGMGAKAGLMPMHPWLPRAHPIAPAHVSALMSGVMVKVALYGLIRVLVEWAGVLPVWLGVAVLGLGGLSAVGGILAALFQRDLKRLLAYSTVENVGIVVLGIGAALVLRSRGADGWASFALAAALLHALGHALFKSLLFLGAGAFEREVGGLDLDRIGGLLRRMPRAGGAFLVGCVAIAGVPPLSGFATEWLTLQALLHVPVSGRPVDGVIGALGLAALAATAALALLCFVKVIGLVLLGQPRTGRAAQALEAPRAMSGAMAVLGAATLAVGLVPGLLLHPLTRIEPWGAESPVAAGLRLPGTGSLPTLGIALVLAVVIGALLLLRRQGGVAAAAPTWACGQLVEPQLGWTGAGFTKPVRLVLETALRPRREIEVTTRGGVLQRVSYTGSMPHVDAYLYRPAIRAALAAAAQARRLQSGRLGTYVAYLVGLVVALLALAKWGLLG